MKVLLLTDADVFAGTESHMLELALGLRDLGEQVLVGCPRPSVLATRADEHNLEVVAIAKGGMVDRPAFACLRGLLSSGAVDVIHAHNGRSALSGALAVRAARCGRLVLTQHFLHPNRSNASGLKGAIVNRAHHWVGAQTHRFIAISPAVRHEMLARREAPAARIVLVPNGISDVCQSSSLQPRDAVRAQWEMEEDAPLVVCVARLEREKDIETLVAAMEGVVREQPAARCIIAGNGAQKEALQAQVARLDLQGHVVLAGFVADALSLVQAADVFVLPSVAEPFGLVLLEAMALSRPIVATRAGGPAEIVIEGETGHLVTPQSPSEMARALLSVLGDGEKAARMGQAGRARFLQEYTRERMCRQILEAYRAA
jgi:glycosyltransferase involved in cell wall biosynthesis